MKSIRKASSSKIPKIIHYCWFGGSPLPKSARKCVDSWKKFFPGYEIRQWDEKNFDVNFCQYTAEAFGQKKYAFLSDVARLYIIEKYGGIYFDTDVEVIKSYDDILGNGAFFGLEKDGVLATGLGFGAEKGNWLVRAMLDDYTGRHFCINGKENLTPCPILNSRVAIEHGFSLENKKETINGITVYPKKYFNPINGFGMQVTIVEETHSIHHYDGSWIPLEEKRRAILREKLLRIFGERIGKVIYRTVFCPYVIVSHIKQKCCRNKKRV